MTTYLVTADRSGNWWAFSVRDLPGAYGQARRLDQVTREARDVVSLITGEPEENIDIKLDARLDPSLERVVSGARSAQEELAARHEATLAAIREAAAELSDQGVSIRDIGTLLGVSFQRISQLLGAKERVGRGR
jgi:predicted RNase H-like HicB family nuclease